MKFWMKILLWTMIIMAVAFGYSGYYFVNYVYGASMEREIKQALDDNSILSFAFETAALNIPSRYDLLWDGTIQQIGANLEHSGEGVRLLRISDEERRPLYVSEGFGGDDALLLQIEAQTRSYRIVQVGESYYVQTGTMLHALDRSLFLETMRDVTGVFQERSQGYRRYRQISLLVLAASAVFTIAIAFWLTRPIRLLTRATRKMSWGDYSYRARIISGDEMGQLTRHFNQMASSLEENVGKLENEVRAKEDFIAAFSHELKTPLTAIIGYADLLRSRKLDEEKRFLSANYIYTEGKRLETMAFRLLDIIVTRRGELNLQKLSVEELFHYLHNMYRSDCPWDVELYYEKGTVWGEGDLLKSVLINLIDNACKASEEGKKIEVYGRSCEGGYRFAVRDFGVGIPADELERITEAFYMIDKSRSRSRNGAGLGLALCVEILKLHNSELMIESTPGEGTCMSFILPEREVDADA